MTLKFPERQWFTIEQLAERWGIPVDLVEHYTFTNQLRYSWQLSEEESDPGLTDGNCYILLREVERFEREECLQSPAVDNENRVEQTGQKPVFDMKSFITDNREKLPEEQMIYELRERGFSNNEIGVALGGTFRKGSNALATQVSRKYNNHKRKLGT